MTEDDAIHAEWSTERGTLVAHIAQARRALDDAYAQRDPRAPTLDEAERDQLTAQGHVVDDMDAMYYAALDRLSALQERLMEHDRQSEFFP